MPKQTFLKAGLVLSGVVLLCVITYREFSYYAEFRHRKQFAGQVARLADRVAAYQRRHSGALPLTIQALASSEPLDLDLRDIIQAGRVSYASSSTFSPNSIWEVTIDGYHYVTEVLPASGAL